MKILGIVPARYASVRFPGKALVEINGKPMVERVYGQALKSRKLDRAVVATDDRRIYDHIKGIGGEATMTDPEHANGTERCNEVALAESAFDYYINLQGDMPYVRPGQIDMLAGLLDGKTELATLAKKIDHADELDNPGIVKVTFNKQREAMYFSRACIPFLRDMPPGQRLSLHDFYKHIGLYGYRKDVLHRIASLPPAPLESAEKLEQLRWMENGHKIKIGITNRDNQTVDSPEDLKKFETYE